MVTFVAKVVNIFQDPNNGVHLNWMLHDRCTFDCSYCPPSNKAGIDSWLKEDKVYEFVNELNNRCITQNKYVTCNFSGGEPTIWKGFGQLIRHLKSLGWLLQLSSNMSRSYRWWEENGHCFDRINASYHSEFVDDDDFYKKINMLDKKTNTTVMIMMNTNPKYFWKAIAFGERIEKIVEDSGLWLKYYPIQLNFGFTKINVSPYSEELKTEVNKKLKYHPKVKRLAKSMTSWYAKYDDGIIKKCSGHDMIAENNVDFSNWLCYAGIDGLFIDARGDLFVGTCRNPYHKNVIHFPHHDGPDNTRSCLGNILDVKNIVWPNKPVICEKTHCGCASDILQSKVRYYDRDTFKAVAPSEEMASL
jgi:organic radical activating enzyme